MSHKLLIGLLASWLLAVGLSLYWDYRQQEGLVLEMARVNARAQFEKDVLFRRWAARHGGVYVPPTKASPPNPYLRQLPERDLVTTTGKALTLINPAYMTRQIHELSNIPSGSRAHITSLTPLRPENAPDAWEATALRSFDQGALESTGLATFNNEPFLRFMRPLITEESCLKCHQQQGYRVGDIRGGISVSVPLKAHREYVAEATWQLMLGHGLIGALGLLGFWLLSRRG
jgi:hypothetical protein